MGTQLAWEGSGGRNWSRVRDVTQTLISDPSPGNIEALVPVLADALDWVDVAPADGPTPPLPVQGDLWSDAVPLPAGRSWSAYVRPRAGVGRRGAGGQRGGRGAAGGGGGRRGGSTGPGSSRSRARAASIGGRVLSAGLAYQRGDAETLRELGLNLTELRSLSGLRRANAILNATVGADGGIEETELRKVNARVLTRMLSDGLDGVAAIRLYIVEYVVQVWASENGRAAHTADQPAAGTHEAERQLRGALAARARQITITTSTTAAELRDAIARSLSLMRRLMKAA